MVQERLSGGTRVLERTHLSGIIFESQSNIKGEKTEIIIDKSP
jgi:hypothetical protein